MNEDKGVQKKEIEEVKEKQGQPSKQNKEGLQKKLEQKSKGQQQLRKQLLAMEFDSDLVDKALQTSKDLEEAVSTIISILEAQESVKMKSKDQVQLFLVVRMDLKMGAGKVAAQCAHATLRAFQIGRRATQQHPQYAMTFIEWMQKGKRQSYFKVKDEEQLFKILQNCKQKGVLTTYIRDAGRTQIAAGSATVGAIGPISLQVIHSVIKQLRPF